MQELKIRLAQFDLEAEPSKTAIHRFGHLAQARCKQDEHRRPQTFNFLGFTHYVGCSRKGNFVVGHKTLCERIQKKLKRTERAPGEFEGRRRQGYDGVCLSTPPGSYPVFWGKWKQQESAAILASSPSSTVQMAEPPKFQLAAVWRGHGSLSTPNTYRSQPVPNTIVDASSWEPDGVTLQVRFCEGGSAYQETEIAAATLQWNVKPS